MPRLIVLLLFAVLVAGACSAEPTAGAPGPGRLAILDENGNVAVIDRDGSSRVDVTDDATASSVYFQPTWSPDAARLAFSRAGVSSSQVVLHDIDTGTQERVDTPFPAFYFSWSRSGDRVAYLGNSARGGLQLSVVDSAGAAIRDDIGQPYYFSWGDNAEMVVHVGADRLDVVDAAGAEVDASLGAPGVFRAPEWTDAGILYLERGTEFGRLVLATMDGEAKLLAEVPGGASFVTSPPGDRIAVQSVAAEQIGDFAVTGRPIAAQATARQLPPNRIVVLDRDTLEWTRIGDEPVLAFWWSPDGDRLLLLTLPDPAVPEVAWQLWSEETGLGELLRFVPGPELFRDVVPFFDQYAQSLSLWSPDGSEFAFAGTLDGEAGIFVVDADTLVPTRVAAGTWVAWSPR